MNQRNITWQLSYIYYKKPTMTFNCFQHKQMILKSSRISTGFTIHHVTTNTHYRLCRYAQILGHFDVTQLSTQISSPPSFQSSLLDPDKPVWWTKPRKKCSILRTHGCTLSDSLVNQKFQSQTFTEFRSSHKKK
jgi:hypothetical protein